jgi:hypothetical protein
MLASSGHIDEAAFVPGFFESTSRADLAHRLATIRRDAGQCRRDELLRLDVQSAVAHYKCANGVAVDATIELATAYDAHIAALNVKLASD